MTVPPVFDVDELDGNLIHDLRDASSQYCEFTYTSAFDQLFLIPERSAVISAFVEGHAEAALLAESLTAWLLRPWSSVRTLNKQSIASIGVALEQCRGELSALPLDLRLEAADGQTLRQMATIFRCLDECKGVGPTIASKLLAPLRPQLFPMIDNPIADAYGFALNAAGYHQYLMCTRAIAQKARAAWKVFGSARDELEDYLCPPCRRWKAPLAKVIDEWNWIRITKGIPRR